MADFIKDPSSVLDYTVDWSNWLASGETISASAFTVESGLTKDSESNGDTSGTVWLSGGTAGTAYSVTHQITTTAGRTDERSFVVDVLSR